MALTGTLKGFGIADILQLIGQQQKTGVLYLKSKEQDVQVYFRDGNIVRAEIPLRPDGPESLNVAMAATVALYDLSRRMADHA